MEVNSIQKGGKGGLDIKNPISPLLLVGPPSFPKNPGDVSRQKTPTIFLIGFCTSFVRYGP
jgi:hypothetical protein